MRNRRPRPGGGRRRRGSGGTEKSFGGAADDRIFTPLIDIFIAIVFFLMVGMTSGGGFVSVTPEVRLPQSAGQQATEELTVAVSPERIFLGGEPVMTVDEAMRSADPSEPYLIPALYERLQEVRGDVQATIGEGETFRGILAIQGDRQVPYAILSRVMYSARKAGFGGFSLHVVRDQESPAAAAQESPPPTSALSSRR